MAKKKKKKASKKKKKLKKTKKKRIKNKKTKKNLKRAKKKKVKIKKKKTVLKKSTPKTAKDPVFKVFPEWKKKGLVNQSSYKEMYEESVSNNEKFYVNFFFTIRNILDLRVRFYPINSFSVFFPEFFVI